MHPLFVSILVLVCAVLGQIAVAVGRAAAEDAMSDALADWRRTLVAVCALSAAAATVIAVTYAVLLAQLDPPGECAPLSNAGMRTLSVASALALGCVPALAAWAARRAHTHRSVGGQVLGQPVALTAALFTFFWLGGGTSC